MPYIALYTLKALKGWFTIELSSIELHQCKWSENCPISIITAVTNAYTNAIDCSHYVHAQTECTIKALWFIYTGKAKCCWCANSEIGSHSSLLFSFICDKDEY